VLDLDDDDGYFECGNLPKRHHRPQAAFEIWRADMHSFRTRLSEALYNLDNERRQVNKRCRNLLPSATQPYR
jgi:hypothetical protein